MKRRIIHIDESKCTGCGLCVSACQEGALALVDGKAKLMRDDYCDGLGNCLPNCPVNAISFIEREAAAFDEAAVLSAQRDKLRAQAAAHVFTGCPGSRVKAITHTADSAVSAPAAKQQSRLSQWPVQIKLVPVNAGEVTLALGMDELPEGAVIKAFVLAADGKTPLAKNAVWTVCYFSANS